MRIYVAAALAALALLASASPGAARMHAQMYCWSQDSEFPVPCEQDDEEDDGSELRMGPDPSPLGAEFEARRWRRGV
jgi:hypothetical protein